MMPRHGNLIPRMSIDMRGHLHFVSNIHAPDVLHINNYAYKELHPTLQFYTIQTLSNKYFFERGIKRSINSKFGGSDFTLFQCS